MVQSNLAKRQCQNMNGMQLMKVPNSKLIEKVRTKKIYRTL